MVEFKYCESRGDFVLTEINGKFWGSLELGPSSGVNFGADLIGVFRSETLSYSEQHERNCEFYWPLDDDLLTLWKTGAPGRIGDYWKRNAHTNLGQSLRSDVIKSLRLSSNIAGGCYLRPRLEPPANVANEATMDETRLSPLSE